MPTITEANKQKFVKYLHAHGKSPVILKNYKFEDIVIENENFGHVIFENCAGKLEIKSTDKKSVFAHMEIKDSHLDSFNLIIKAMHVSRSENNLSNTRLEFIESKITDIQIHVKNKLSAMFFHKGYMLPWLVFAAFVFCSVPALAALLFPLLFSRCFKLFWAMADSMHPEKKPEKRWALKCGLSLGVLIYLLIYIYKGYLLVICAPVAALCALSANIVLNHIYGSFEFMTSKIILKQSQVTSLKITKERLNYEKLYDTLKYLLLTEKSNTQITIEDTKIVNFEQENSESIFKDEEYFFLAEANNLFLDSFSRFHELERTAKLKLIEPFIEINNKKFIAVYHHSETIAAFWRVIFICLLDYFAVFFIRPKNVLLSLSAMLLVGALIVFASYNITIKDNYVQTAIQNHQYKECEERNNHCTSYANERGKKESRIAVPSFYDDYNPFYYTLSIMTSFTGLDDKESFKPNNPVSQFMTVVYKIMGLIYSAAIFYHLSKNFVIRLIGESEEKE